MAAVEDKSSSIASASINSKVLSLIISWRGHALSVLEHLDASLGRIPSSKKSAAYGTII